MGPERPFIGRESSELISLFTEHTGGAAISSIKGHLFRLWAPAFPRHAHMRSQLDQAGTIDEIKLWNSDMSRRAGIRCEPYVTG